MDAAKYDALTSFARMAFDELRRPGDTTAHLSEYVASAVSVYAASSGIPLDAVQEWAQHAYGSVWVRKSNLNPGLDFKEVLAHIKSGYVRGLGLMSPE